MVSQEEGEDQKIYLDSDRWREGLEAIESKEMVKSRHRPRGIGGGDPKEGQ